MATLEVFLALISYQTSISYGKRGKKLPYRSLFLVSNKEYIGRKVR